jgi:hypothetical protein
MAEIYYRGFTIECEQTQHPQIGWTVVVRFIDGKRRLAAGAYWATTEASAIASGKAMVDCEIAWWGENRTDSRLKCPYPESVFG